MIMTSVSTDDTFASTQLFPLGSSISSLKRTMEIILKASEFEEAIVVGGHNINSKLVPPSLTCGDLFLKPLLKEREGNFYLKALKEESARDEYLGQLAMNWIPKCLGLTTIRNVQYIVMENLYKNIKRPCILDLKMGLQTYEDGASKEKKEYEIKKFPLQKVLGFRVTGFKKVVPLQHKDHVLEKDFLKRTVYDNYVHYKGNSKPLRNQLTSIEDVSSLLQYFFSTEERDMWPHFEPKISKILSIMKKQHSFKFISSSLLFIYEGDINEPPNATVGLIDFAHAMESSSFDEGYVHGLETIIAMMNQNR